MSATRDKNQKFTFVYSNLYQLYKKGAEEKPVRSPVHPKDEFQVVSGRVIKAQDLHHSVEKFNPVSLLKPAKPDLKVESKVDPKLDPLLSLKQNLQSLSQLHERLRFMLSELEDLVKE